MPARHACVAGRRASAALTPSSSSTAFPTRRRVTTCASSYATPSCIARCTGWPDGRSPTRRDLESPDAILEWALERMRDVRLEDHVTEQVKPERDARAEDRDALRARHV